MRVAPFEPAYGKDCRERRWSRDGEHGHASLVRRGDQPAAGVCHDGRPGVADERDDALTRGGHDLGSALGDVVLSETQRSGGAPGMFE